MAFSGLRSVQKSFLRGEESVFGSHRHRRRSSGRSSRRAIGLPAPMHYRRADMRVRWGGVHAWLVAALAVLVVCVDAGYRKSSQSAWTDKTPQNGFGNGRGTLGGDVSGGMSLASAGGRRGDGKLLNQAVDAFRQASHLEKALKRSETARPNHSRTVSGLL